MFYQLKCTVGVMILIASLFWKQFHYESFSRWCRIQQLVNNIVRSQATKDNHKHVTGNTGLKFFFFKIDLVWVRLFCIFFLRSISCWISYYMLLNKHSSETHSKKVKFIHLQLIWDLQKAKMAVKEYTLCNN